MTNELLAVYLTAFYIICSRKLDLCAGVLLYYAACIISASYEPGYAYDSAPESFYITESLIDLAAILLICYLSQFHKGARILYWLYAVNITIAMSLNGLMLLDQASGLNRGYWLHLSYNDWAQYIDVFFAVLGSANVSRYFIRFLPFGSG